MIEDQLIQFVSVELVGGGAEVTAEDEIVLDGTVDSLGVTRLVDFIEQRFGVSIPAEDVTIDNFRSISTLAAYIRSHSTPQLSP